jgi:hypothetical protein
LLDDVLFAREARQQEASATRALTLAQSKVACSSFFGYTKLRERASSIMLHSPSGWFRIIATEWTSKGSVEPREGWTSGLAIVCNIWHLTYDRCTFDCLRHRVGRLRQACGASGKQKNPGRLFFRNVCYFGTVLEKGLGEDDVPTRDHLGCIFSLAW